MPTPLRTFVAAGVVTVAAVGVGLLLTEAEPQSPAPVAVPSIPLAEYDTSAVTARRAPFCEAVSPERVAEALGAAPGASATWAPGDLAPASAGAAAGDVVAEHGCTWSVEGGRTASTWVFSPPVTAERAGRLVQAAGRAEGCAPVPDAAAYGAPSAGLVCERGDAGVEVSFRGLFGDAWLACSLSGPAAEPRPELTDAAGRWCVAAAVAAAQGSAA